MEKRTEYLFYIGIRNEGNEPERQAETDADGKCRLSKAVLPFWDGQLVVYSCLVPEAFIQPSKKLWRWQRRRWERHRAKQVATLIEEAVQTVYKELNGERITYVYPIGEIEHRLSEVGFLQECDREALTDRLCAIKLCRERKSNREATLSVSLPAECGELAVIRLITIIQPYLPRINIIVFVGEEDAGSRLLEEYLYEEYGIVMTYARLPERKTIWMDLRDGQDQILSKYAKENEICHINAEEVLKFLDTAAKNRYNTKVN